MFQVIQHLKTKCKLIKMCDTVAEAKETLAELDAHFLKMSWPIEIPMFFSSKNNRHYTVQGAVELNNGTIVICSINNEDTNNLIK